MDGLSRVVNLLFYIFLNKLVRSVKEYDGIVHPRIVLRPWVLECLLPNSPRLGDIRDVNDWI